MAQLKGLMDELDIINEKLEKMNGLLDTAIEKYKVLQTRDAELHVHPTTEQDNAYWHCPNCSYINYVSSRTCLYCKAHYPNRSDVE
jgi:hypothetical protein